MKKLTANTIVAAIGLVWGTAALAGSITSPASNAAATKYAAEALVSTTDVTLPNIVYTMGVARTTAQDFTIIVTPSAGSTFTAGSCAAAVPTVGGAGAGTATVKRASTTECAYEVDVTTAFTTATTLTFAGLTLDSHNLATAGNSASISLNLWDLGETARIDNNAAVTRTVATSLQAVNIYAAASDTSTVADVNATTGPLTGFVAGGDDSATVAQASLTFDNNTALGQDATGAADFDFTATTGTAAITLTGTTSGVKTNKFCIDLDSDATLCETGEVMTVTSGAASLSGISSAAFPAVTTSTTRKVSFEVDGTTSLGTARTFALTGTITPQVGAAEALADTNGKNATFWVWSANASELMTPYFSTNSVFLTRFFFLNTGSSAVSYTATCYNETGNTAVYGSAKTGSLIAGGQTAVNAADICTFPGAPRGAIKFTINAPINTVKGLYQTVDPVTLNNAMLPLSRPYNQANTTE